MSVPKSLVLNAPQNPNISLRAVTDHLQVFAVHYLITLRKETCRFMRHLCSSACQLPYEFQLSKFLICLKYWLFCKKFTQDTAVKQFCKIPSLRLSGQNDRNFKIYFWLVFILARLLSKPLPTAPDINSWCVSFFPKEKFGRPIP